MLMFHDDSFSHSIDFHLPNIILAYIFLIHPFRIITFYSAHFARYLQDCLHPISHIQISCSLYIRVSTAPSISPSPNSVFTHSIIRSIDSTAQSGVPSINMEANMVKYINLTFITSSPSSFNFSI